MILSLRIRRKSNLEPSFPEITDDNFGGELEVEAVGILEKGMQSGKTSIALSLKTEDGKYYMAQMSADQIEMIFAGIRGAEQNWAENPE